MGQTANGELSSVAAELFYGHIDEDDLFSFPALSEEQREVAKTMCDAVGRYMDESVDSPKMDDESLIPEEVYAGLAEMGLMGIGVPEERGGLGLDTSLYCLVLASVMRSDASLGTMLAAHQSIGYKPLLVYGTEAQKQKYLPRLASGELIASFCLTEPGAGSDAFSIKTKAVESDDGTYTINGQKLWITNGGRADFYTVFCKADHLNSDVKGKISCFIVEKGMPGLSFGEKEKKMGIKASETRAVFFDNVKVPAENLLGKPGKGFKIAMNVLNTGRLSLGAGCVGGMKSVLALAVNHASHRKQFNQTLASFGMIQDKLARMATDTYMAESLVYYTSGRVEQGQKEFAVESAICKVFCSEKMWETVDAALQIAGGVGYMQEYPYERLMRDARINLIFEGSNEVMRVFIALSGMRGPGETLKDLGRLAGDATKALLDPIKSVGILSTFVRRRIDKMMSKSFSRCHPDLERYGQSFSKMLSHFSIEVENALIKHSSNIIGNEYLQKRIADMAIALMVTVATIARTSHILTESDADDERKNYVKNMTRIGLREQHRNFMRAYREMGSNIDGQIKRTSKQTEEYGGYGFDIVDH